MKIGRWSQTAASNNATPPDGWPEGQAPSTVNDCAREMMGQIRVYLEDAEWFDKDFTPTFVNANSFTVPGNQTSALAAARMLKLHDATDIYRGISAVSFTVVTTIQLKAGTAITSSLSSFAIAILNAGAAQSLPRRASFSAVEVTGTLSISGNIATTTNLQVAGTTTLSGAVVMNTTLTVSGAAVVGGTLLVGGVATFNTGTHVNGAASLSGAVIANTTLQVQGTTTLSGAVVLNTTLTVSGAAVFNSTLQISGNTTIVGQLHVDGSVTLSAASMVMNASNAGIEIGAFAVNTPFIDFHSSGNNNDNDARIIASGGTAAAGSGSLAVVAKVFAIGGRLQVSGTTTLSGAVVMNRGLNVSATASCGMNIHSSGNQSANNGVATTFAIPGAGTYLVATSLGGDAPNYGAVAVVAINTIAGKLTTIQTAALLTLSLSGTTLQLTQNSGTTQTVAWSVLRFNVGT